MLITRRQTALALLLLATARTLPARAQDVLGETGIRGAGSTFAYPVLSRWSLEYRSWQARGGDFPVANSGLEDAPATTALEYEPVGSLAGTLRVKDGSVDFGASDMPLSSEELQKLGLGQFPIVIGGVVIAINVDGVQSGALRLTGALLADIYLGKVTRWSDPALRAHNPGLKLPDATISVVRRAEGSGTTFNFTSYLSAVSPEWKLKAGAGLLVPWPLGHAAKGNEGMAEQVKATKNSIGYVEYARAAELGLGHALLQNAAGQFVRPGPASFQAAAASANWQSARDLQVLLGNAPGAEAYPITATVFALMRRSTETTRARTALDFFRWSLESGADIAAQLGYVPLPSSVVQQVKAYWRATLEGR